MFIGFAGHGAAQALAGLALHLLNGDNLDALAGLLTGNEGSLLVVRKEAGYVRLADTGASAAEHNDGFFDRSHGMGLRHGVLVRL
ncbi:hypothetical protein [Geopseudomonas aromaticivorans]